MDAAANPFAPGAGTQPPALTGRGEQLEVLRVLLARLDAGRPGRSVVLCGLRGMGKTVLLREMYRRTLAAGWRASIFEARSGLDLRDTFTSQAFELLAGLSPKAKAKARLADVLEFTRALRATVKPGPAIGIDINPDLLASLGHSLDADLGGLLVELGRFAEAQGIGVAFFCDELQELDQESMSALCAAVHRVGQENLPVCVIGAGLPALPGQLATAKSYAERLFQYEQIGLLDEEATRAALADPFTAAGVELVPSALDRLTDYSTGYPTLIQLLGQCAWDLAEEPVVGAGVADAAEPAAFDRLSQELFRARWQRATGRERDYLRALASVGTTGSSAAVAKEAGFPGQGAAGTVRQELIAKGLVWAPRRGQIAFTIPLFEVFIREQTE